MRHASRFALLTAVLIASAAAWPAGQVPPPPPPPPPIQAPQPPAVGTGFIAGQIVDIVTGKPIPEATVSIAGRIVPVGRGGAPPVFPPVTADAQGRFYFARLVAGTYLFGVTRTGYLSIGALGIELSDGERRTDIRFRLQKMASLAGTLRDEIGDPVVGTDVLLLRRSVVNGRQSWNAAGKARSDDRGVYRLGNLQAGDYIVCACTRDPIPFDNVLLTTLGSEPLQLMNVAARALSVGSDVVSLDSTLRTYAPTFYPNSATLARATRVTLAPGDEKTDLDMNLALVRATRVSGTIVGAPGPVQAQSMRLIPEGDADVGIPLFSLSPMLVQPDGRFDFTTVPPGQYRLVVVHRPGNRSGGPSGAALSFAGASGAPQGETVVVTMASTGPVGADPPLWASEPIAVGENGVSGVAVTLNRALAVTGRVQWIGGAPQPPVQTLSRASVTMMPVNLSDPLVSPLGGLPVGRFSPDATFLVPGALPGKYTITATALPGFPTLKSVMMGGLDLTDLPLEVGTKDLADVVITYVDTPMATLTVTANPAAPGTPANDGTPVLVFPADRKFWTEPAAARRRFRSTALSAKNIAIVPDLPAGDYFVMAATLLDVADWMEPTKLDALSRRAQRVSLVDGGKASIEVRR